MALQDICRRLTGFIDEASADPREQIATAVSLSLDGIDIRSAHDRNVTELTPGELADIRAMAEDAGLVIASVGSPVNKIELDPARAPEQADLLRRSIAAALALGTDRIRIFSPSVAGTDREEDFEAVAEWMTPQVREIEDAGLIALLENDSRFYGAFPAGARRLLERFGGPQFRAVFDFANAVMVDQRPAEDWMTWIIPHLDTIHIKDARASDKVIVPAGEGDGQIAESLQLLSQAGWSGTITMEPHLAKAEFSTGFAGPELYGVAVRALRGLLEVDTQTP
ncbi:MAG: sugar phosphate isomerase/epimerase [Fimbriimonadaceae bacterium]|nr:sugar phosphate isomerase/epimerase [Fimbriimonadaceae bacterium]